jgi:hypothetical protein
MVTKYTEFFNEDIPDSGKIRSIIDYQFESKTKSFMQRQTALFTLVFFIPLLVVIFADGKLKYSTKAILLSISLIGELILFSQEIMSMVVEGFEVYLNDKWNYPDML